MSLQSKDKRRSLYEFEYPVTKILDIHKDCLVGNHYHKKRDETFILLRGRGISLIDDVTKDMGLHEEFAVRRGKLHSFYLFKGSLLLEFATKKYDPKDDYKV